MKLPPMTAIMCVRIEDMPEPFSVCDRGTCAKCDAPIWVSMASRAMAPDAPTWCDVCAIATARALQRPGT